MNHDGCDFINKSNKGIIVLTKNEQYRVRTGRVLDFHFHSRQFPNSTIIFFVSDQEHVVTPNSKIGKEFIREGSVCPIVINKETMLKLESGEIPGVERVLDTVEPPFIITVMTSEVYKKLLRDRKEKYEK